MKFRWTAMVVLSLCTLCLFMGLVIGRGMGTKETQKAASDAIDGSQMGQRSSVTWEWQCKSCDTWWAYIQGGFTTGDTLHCGTSWCKGVCIVPDYAR